MIRIALFCATGMSTGMMVERMRKAAASEGVEAEINAYAETELTDRIDNLDVVLLGPQIAYMKKKLQTICDEHNVAMAVIAPVDYGMLEGAKVFKMAQGLVKK